MSRVSRAEGYRRARTVTASVAVVALGAPVLVTGAVVAERSHLASRFLSALQNGGDQGGGGLGSGSGGGFHAVSSGS